LISIRLKILALLVAALAISLLSYLFVGTSLIVKDKTSYIYDYNLAQVKAAGDQIDSQLERLRSTFLLMGNLVNPALPKSNADAVQRFFKRHQNALSIAGFAIFRPLNSEHFKPDSNFSDDASARQAGLEALGWSPLYFEKNEFATGSLTPDSKTIPVGLRLVDAAGKPFLAVSRIELNRKVFEKRESNFKLMVVNSRGQPLAGTEGSPALDPESVTLVNTLLSSEFSSGARDWSRGSEEFIVAYEKLAKLDAMVIGLISKEESFHAARALVQRSIALGISILLMSIALTYVFARGLTRRLSEMWHATQRVALGDFSVRVDATRGKDEISGLALSFNKMSERIKELMAETAEKVRMEKELETAQAVQNRFFPEKGFSHPNIRLAGKAIAATECAGDWWQYVKIGKHLLVAEGDVTGHGVSSALVTAAAYGAFSISVGDIVENESQTIHTPPMDKLLKNLDRAVRAAGGEHASMTMVLSSIDLETGMMKTLNAAHRAIYVYRKSPDAASNPTKSFKVITDGRLPSLGCQISDLPPPGEFQLVPGDVVFWYTDGLVECRNPTGECLDRKTLMATMANVAEQNGSDADRICDAVLAEFVRFLAENAKNPDDDTTLVVATIPMDAKFT